MYNKAGVIAELDGLMPLIELQPEPSHVVIASEFLQVQPDSQNNGTLHPDGSRKPPLFDDYVDDNLYADIGSRILQAIAASIAGIV